jgi:hypothetical protein
MSWINRLLGSVRKSKLEDQLNEELQFHIEMRIKEFVAAGMNPEEARHKAARQRRSRRLSRRSGGSDCSEICSAPSASHQ